MAACCGKYGTGRHFDWCPNHFTRKPEIASGGDHASPAESPPTGTPDAAATPHEQPTQGDSNE